MARRGWPPGARAVLVVLAVQAVLGPRAGAEPPPAAGTAGVETPAPPAPGADRVPPDLEDRLRRLETLGAGVLEKNERLTEQNQQLAEQNRQLAEQNRQLASQLQDVNRRHEELVRRLDRLAATAAPPPAVVTPTATPAPPPIVATPTPPVVATPATADGTPARSDLVERTQALAPTPEVNPQGDSPRDQEPGQDRSRFLIGGYDWDKSQFVLVQPRDPERTPFALNFDLITELRYTGFARSAQTWTDSAGVVLPVRNYDTFEVNRNWFQFSGYALDPRLQFVAVIFNSSTSNSTIFLGWLDYVFSRAFTLSGGYFKIPGSREWSNSFRYTLGADRTMATTFFRPGMSPGIWASGEPWANFHYIGMIANSFNGLDLAGNRIDTNMDYSGSVWWEPFGAFGPGPSDVEWHERFTPRIGTSLTFSREQLPGPAAVLSNPENTLFRLSDGTPLSTPNALATGVQVAATSVQLWAIDAAFKYRGLSFSGEYYFRWLDDFRHTGPRLPIRSLFDNGAYAQASYFVIPKRLEGYARYSFVTGRFGGGDEWSGGFNWYVLGTRNWRMTFDVTRINHSPAENLLTGYRAGESGTLFQLQMLTDF